jgi:hypothetical protein
MFLPLLQENPKLEPDSFFSSIARKEGFEQISAIFQETSDNEKEHVKLFFQHLKGGTAQIDAAYPACIIGLMAFPRAPIGSILLQTNRF